MHAPNWCRRLWPYLGRRQAEEDLQEELRLHLELERERLRDAGVPEAEASRAARRKLGNAPLIRERTRDVWGWRWLDDLGRDVRHAARGLRREPGFTATVVCVLALGIGANTAMFSIVYGVLLRPLPYPDSEAIVRIRESFGDSRRQLSRYAIPVLQEAAESFEQLAAYGSRSVEWARPDGAVTLRGATVSPSMFPLLRATPHLGRLFTEEEGRDGAAGIVLLSSCLDRPLCIGPGHRRDCPDARRRAAHRDRGAGRGVLLPEPRGGNLEALRDDVRLVLLRPRQRARTTPRGRVAGAAAAEVRTILQHTDDRLYAQTRRPIARSYAYMTGRRAKPSCTTLRLFRCGKRWSASIGRR